MAIKYQSVSVHKVFNAIQGSSSGYLVDVRASGEFADGHAEGAISIPLDELSLQSLRQKTGDQQVEQRTVYLTCQSGARAEQAALKLQRAGLSNAVIMKGGINDWRNSQLPMVRTSRLPSLERQTQIALGGLLLLILFKGFVIHPLFFGLIALLGVGLITAGVTARCSLTALLARMPWNRQSCALQ